MDHPSVIDEVDLCILRLLFEGLGEDAIGRRLGIGRRTVQRRIRNLMLRWQVKGRVALGARAQQLGLLASRV
ncbi:LuxR C-terminal-related transcriptional regulator [Streptomyces sp. NPDC059010]|uniref:LuxR C-terminal-related transcriptional regulator n=1 Tax=Streptomyces sp. NPDC059010 TaxID=3346695 RepID=UPI003689BB69